MRQQRRRRGGIWLAAGRWLFSAHDEGPEEVRRGRLQSALMGARVSTWV
jgi:hypothetical protein